MILTLRGYQESGLIKLRDGFIAGHRCQLLVSPCGSGKTETAISLLQATKDKGNRSAMVMDRRVLCDQTSERLLKYDIDHGVLMSGHYRFRPDRLIQVCSAQTLEARGSFPGLKLMIIDECHCQRKSVTDFIKNNKQVRVIGLSASPFAKGMGAIYTNIVNAVTTRELVNDGMLAPLKVFVAKQIDMTGAKKIGGEWSDKEASTRGIQITGDIVTEWVKKTHEIFGEPKKTIVFCAGVAHGEDLSRKFAEAGYNFICLSYRDENEYKAEKLKDFAKPDTNIHGIIATDLLTKGFDQADVMIGISARPFTKSFSSHVQQLGRVMRPHSDKSEAIWICHSGNYLRFQDQWEDLYGNGVDTLDDGAEKSKPEPTDKEKEVAKCPICGALWTSMSDICSHCGHVRVRRNDVITNPGELIEISPSVKKEKYSSEYKEKFYQELIGLFQSQGKNINRAFFIYKEKFGIEPVWKKHGLPPSNEVINFVHSRNIAYAKAQQKNANR